jgi:hypothetical protein
VSYLVAGVAVVVLLAFEFAEGAAAGELRAVLGVSLQGHPLGLRLAQGTVQVGRQLLVHATQTLSAAGSESAEDKHTKIEHFALFHQHHWYDLRHADLLACSKNYKSSSIKAV